MPPVSEAHKSFGKSIKDENFEASRCADWEGYSFLYVYYFGLE
jgi:hypothetical protein